MNQPICGTSLLREEYSGSSGGLFLLQDYLGQAVESLDSDAFGG